MPASGYGHAVGVFAQAQDHQKHNLLEFAQGVTLRHFYKVE